VEGKDVNIARSLQVAEALLKKKKSKWTSDKKGRKSSRKKDGGQIESGGTERHSRYKKVERIVLGR
jgi:hypothetical protein